MFRSTRFQLKNVRIFFMYFLFKTKKQIVISDLIQALMAEASTEFVKNKVKRDVLKQMAAFDATENDR